MGAPDDPAAAKQLRQAAIAAGVDHIDTAQYYGPNVVNELIRDAPHPYPPELAIVSKAAVRRDDAGAVLPDDDPDRLRTAIEDNLRSLKVDQLAAVNLRLPGHRGVDARFDERSRTRRAPPSRRTWSWLTRTRRRCSRTASTSVALF